MGVGDRDYMRSNRSGYLNSPGRKSGGSGNNGHYWFLGIAAVLIIGGFLLKRKSYRSAMDSLADHLQYQSHVESVGPLVVSDTRLVLAGPQYTLQSIESGQKGLMIENVLPGKWIVEKTVLKPQHSMVSDLEEEDTGEDEAITEFEEEYPTAIDVVTMRHEGETGPEADVPWAQLKGASEEFGLVIANPSQFGNESAAKDFPFVFSERRHSNAWVAACADRLGDKDRSGFVPGGYAFPCAPGPAVQVVRNPAGQAVVISIKTGQGDWVRQLEQNFREMNPPVF